MAERDPSHRSHDRRRDNRSRSPRASSHREHRHHRKRPPRNDAPVQQLPFNSTQLTKRDFESFKPMFGHYLDIQKGKIMEDLDALEIRGRWKSFIGKWNRGELSEGWYDPSTLQKAIESAAMHDANPIDTKPVRSEVRRQPPKESAALDSDSDDSIGPALPGRSSRTSRMGPSIPNMQDLALKREMEAEDGLTRRDDIRYERKSERKEQKAALDELAPRAEAGTRERQLDKKKELNEKMKSFREKSPGAAELPDTELMGGGDGIEGYKKEKEKFERKRNEREVRKEEFLRARQAEREERMQEYRAKEDSTMSMLKALVKQNFG